MALVLVIDDEPEIRALLRRWLEREGLSVIEAEDGEVGIRLFREHSPEVVITDIIMPQKEGIETIMDLRREFSSAKIIAISGGGTAMTSGACLHLAARLGAARAFSKPLDMSRLLEAVRELTSS
jgi:DNA-binding response OmpR family regulator